MKEKTSKEKKMNQIILTQSKSGIPCYWEYGGGASNTGRAGMVCDKDGMPKKAIYVRRKGSLSNGNHALIPLRENDYIVQGGHHRGDFNIKIYKVVEFVKQKTWNQDRKEEVEVVTANTEEVNSFYNGEWDEELEDKFVDIVEAIKKKATSYHCRRPYFIKEEAKS